MGSVLVAGAIACNAIVGIEDVRLRQSRTRPDADEGTDGPGSEDDASTPRIDRGTLALGLIHACARLPTGNAVCWGDNGAGQLGDGLPYDAGNRNEQAVKPQAVSGVSKVVDIASGGTHTCVVEKSGPVLCWGANTFGQLGNGTTNRSPVAVPVGDLEDAIAIGAGTSFTCAIRRGRSVACWGNNTFGQLGDGKKVSLSTPTQVSGLEGAASLSLGSDHACAVLVSKEVMCWGRNSTGQLGNGSTNDSLTPTKLSSLTDIAQVASAARFSCARQTGGRVLCWGSNEFGQLGNGTTSLAVNPSPSVVSGISDAVYIWAGTDHVCAVRRAGNVVCWGRGDDGQLGNVADAATRPTAVPAITGARSVSTGGRTTCALLDEGRAYCWGSNSLGQAGNGNAENPTSPGPVSNFP